MIESCAWLFVPFMVENGVDEKITKEIFLVLGFVERVGGFVVGFVKSVIDYEVGYF